MEMFFSKEPGTFLKHLPAVTLSTLKQSGALANLQQYATFTGQLQSQQKNLQTFEAGPVMLAVDDPKTGQKFEVVVDNDSLNGDQDDIELSFRTYKDNQAQRTPFMPRLVFSMKTESGQWTLNNIAITVNLPLADPDFLKSITDKMKSAASMAGPQMHIQAMPPQGVNQSPINMLGSDASALASLRKILTAEITYAAAYPTVGFTCTLSDLDGFGAAEPNEHQAMLISSGLASGKHQGYNFTLSGCSGVPATSFKLTAAPAVESYGRRALCTDESGAIRSSADGHAATCLSSGTPIQ